MQYALKVKVCICVRMCVSLYLSLNLSTSMCVCVCVVKYTVSLPFSHRKRLIKKYADAMYFHTYTHKSIQGFSSWFHFWFWCHAHLKINLPSLSLSCLHSTCICWKKEIVDFDIGFIHTIFSIR